MLRNFFKSLWFLSILTIPSLGILLLLTFNQKWQFHLATDVYGFYYPTAKHFFTTFSFLGLPNNPYQPGVIFFLLLPSVALLFKDSWQFYLYGLVSINILLILLHIYIFRKYSLLAPLLFLGILLAAGPIVLYRQELFVSLFVVLSIFLFSKGKEFISSFLLGIATTIKVYPFLIFPYLLILIFQKQNFKTAVKALLIFILPIITIFGIYALFFSSVPATLASLNENAIKPLHIESVLASVITISEKIGSGSFPLGKGDYGIYGLDPRFIIFPLTFYNYFWILPLGFFYTLFFLDKKRKNEFKFIDLFCIFLIFIIFSKILTPQYLLWAFILFPFLRFKKLKMILPYFIIICILLITQFIYPLHYDKLISFYTNGSNISYFYLLVLRNFLLLVLLFTVYNSQTIKTAEHE